MHLRYMILALVALVATEAFAQQGSGAPRPNLTPPAVTGAMSDREIGATLGAWLADLNRQGVFNGAVLVARDGREIYASAYGVASLEPRVPLNANTRFPLASIGKQFTHVAVLQLIQAGRLAPETTIGDVLPDYPNAVSRGATVEQLINHRGGIADIIGPAFRDEPKDRYVANHNYYEYVTQLPPTFAPGAREQYCNGRYVVLGEMIERITGVQYEQYVAAHVLAPAGMTRSGFFRHDQLPENSAQFIGRPRGPQSELQDVSRWHGVSASAAGNIYAPLRDLLAYDNAVREGRLLNAEYSAQMLHAQPQAGRATARIGYAGGAPGVNTAVTGNGAWTVIVLTNHEPPIAEAVLETVFPLLAGPRPQ